MSALNFIISKYATFESKVQDYSSSYFRPYCSVCTDVCCKPEFCQETLDSPFLALVRATHKPAAPYSSDTGWLSETGCILTIGRPPVCYEFLCDEIMTSRSSAMHLYVDNVFSKLISHLGRRIYRGKHLVEIWEHKDLHRVKRSSFENRLMGSQAAFQVIRLFHEENRLPPQNLEVLRKIAPPP
ncbi:MAG: hypothetical protein PVI06_09945 [Desulfobacterales bacterium]